MIRTREVKTVTSKFRTIFVLIILAGAAFLFYKFVLTRTVYYEIGGIKIPSKYNILTGTAKPIDNYKGRPNLRTVETHKANKLGLSDDEVVIAKVRWAIFEEWANSRPEYRGWQKDAKIFKKANDAFRRQLGATGRKTK
jgi:hypothetical protein